MPISHYFSGLLLSLVISSVPFRLPASWTKRMEKVPDFKKMGFEDQGSHVYASLSSCESTDLVELHPKTKRSAYWLLPRLKLHSLHTYSRLLEIPARGRPIEADYRSPSRQYPSHKRNTPLVEASNESRLPLTISPVSQPWAEALIPLASSPSTFLPSSEINYVLHI